jgi:hypothetical protein
MSEAFVEGCYEEVFPILPLVDSGSLESYGDGFTNKGGYRSLRAKGLPYRAR